MSDYRHHTAHVVLVPVPVGGSPETARQSKPRPYKRIAQEPWRPQRSIPSRGKAAALVRLLDGINRQNEVVREMMHPTPLRP